ncbi:hypothetical protein BSR28_05925 [Boudabousia liubingyangii]|uniref:serine hydrolase domain-containing protein n=1 Tax=Boudabousia liubingyangii TaxID=1921764 RepID=UPI00093FAD8B|nr:serine hydrolase domain-containing protein [Boudabousia liubingyangii]OKL46957.1 hypothetical protein BSR28_05925 [Boudabousia liubingyangii]
MGVETLNFPHAVIVTNADHDLAQVGEVDTVFPLASVTKLFAAWAVAVEVERGTISYTDPCGPEGSTLEHLMSHAAGLDFDSDQIITEVGTRRIYSNRSIELGTDCAAKNAGVSAIELIQRNVIEPLGISSWKLAGSVAHAGYINARDLAVFAREVLRPTLISEAFAQEVLRVHYPELVGIVPGFGHQDPNSWSLGFEVKGNKTPHWTAPDTDPDTVGHFGQSGSFLWASRKSGLAAVFVGEKPFSAAHKAIWPQLNSQIWRDFGPKNGN